LFTTWWLEGFFHTSKKCFIMLIINVFGRI